MAMIDFEISGQYYLSDLKTDFNNWTNSKFFVNKTDAHLISEKQRCCEIIVNKGSAQQSVANRAFRDILKVLFFSRQRQNKVLTFNKEN